MAGAVTCGIFPLALLLLSLVESDHETILGMNGLLFGAIIIFAGFAMYYATSKIRARFAPGAAPETVAAD